MVMCMYHKIDVQLSPIGLVCSGEAQNWNWQSSMRIQDWSRNKSAADQDIGELAELCAIQGLGYPGVLQARIGGALAELCVGKTVKNVEPVCSSSTMRKCCWGCPFSALRPNVLVLIKQAELLVETGFPVMMVA